MRESLFVSQTEHDSFSPILHSAEVQPSLDPSSQPVTTPPATTHQRSKPTFDKPPYPTIRLCSDLELTWDVTDRVCVFMDEVIN